MTAPRYPRAWIAAVGLALTALVPSASATGDVADACAATPTQPGFAALFDGTEASLTGWKHSGPGTVTRNAECVLQTSGGLGLFSYAQRQFQSYTLRLDWKIEKVADNSGIFIGYPGGSADTHNVAINRGYEVQVDQIGRTTGDRKLITGALYNVQGPNVDTRLEVAKPTDWNTYEITVDAPKISIKLNGVVVNEFTSTMAGRDLSVPGALGTIGLQAHGTGDVAYFRNVQLKELVPGSAGGGPRVPVVGDLARLRNNTGIFQDPRGAADFDGGGFSYDARALQLAGVTPGSKVSADGVTFTWPTTNPGANDNVIAAGQTLPLPGVKGSTRVAFLAAATNGPSTGQVTLNYVDAGGAPVSTTAPITVSDWTLNGDKAQPSEGNVVAIRTQFRALGPGAPVPQSNTNVYVVSVPLDPSLTLQSIKLPRASGGRIQVFDIVVK